MHLANPAARSSPATQAARVNPLLNLNMRFGLELQISLPRIRAIIVV